MNKQPTLIDAVILVIAINFIFTNFCFAQSFYPSRYPAQLRFGARGAANQKDFWGYTDIFLPIYNSEDSILYGANDFLFFADAKLAITDFASNEENLGLGVRYLASDVFFEQGIIIGSNVFYDSVYSQNGIRHTQVGFGVELLSQEVDLRVNYYRPTPDVKIVDDTFEFRQNSINRNYKEEEALRGYDAELGIPVPFLTNLVETWIYAGGYHYNSTLAEDIDGVKGRVEINSSSLLTLTFELKDDNVYGSNTFVGGYVSLPFDLGKFAERKNPFEGWRQVIKFREGKRSLTERMTEPVARDINIITADKRQETKVHDLIYVDNANDGDALEDGSLVHPYNTLQEALDNDYAGVWIYVQKGDGTSTGYTGNFTLDDSVVVWGQGYQYLGLGGGAYPLLDGGGAGDVITLGNDNTVMGLRIQNGTRGIYGENITGTTIKNNIITGNNGTGIRLQTSGTTICSAVISDNTITSNITGNGITLYSEGSSNITANLSNNLISGNDFTGVYLWSGDSSTLSATFRDNNIISNLGSGIYLQSNTSSTLSCMLSGNTIYDNNNGGVNLQYLGTSILTLDIGNGGLGSTGYNAIHGNTGDEIEDLTATPAQTVKAENNWWGRSPPSENEFTGLIDYTPWLISNPNL